MSVLTAIQDYLVEQLKLDPAVAALVDGRVFDNIRRDAQFPYISLGNLDFQPVDGACIAGREVTVQFDGWVREQGALRNTNTLLDAMYAALHYPNDVTTLSEGEIANQRVIVSRVMRDPDGLTGHAVLQVQLLVNDG